MKHEQGNTVTASITLVEHGYQIDIRDHTRATADGQGVEVASMCRDFGGDYAIGDMANSVVATLIHAMESLEANHRKIASARRPLTHNQQKLLSIMESRPGEWIHPYGFGIRASVGASLFRRGIVERRYEKAPYHWATFRIKRASG